MSLHALRFFITERMSFSFISIEFNHSSVLYLMFGKSLAFLTEEHCEAK